MTEADDELEQHKGECLGECKACRCSHPGRSEDGEHLCRCGEGCEHYIPSYNHDQCGPVRLKLPDTGYFGSHRTKMAAQAFIQGVKLVFDANSAVVPDLDIEEAKNPTGRDSREVVWQVVRKVICLECRKLAPFTCANHPPQAQS